MIKSRDVQKKTKPSQPSLPKQHPRILSISDFKKKTQRMIHLCTRRTKVAAGDEDLDDLSIRD
ncbi:hypothetical protein BpHYR1_004866 [Brachionus plicatilis]|uniref:Uncharacterized protein n=1 Tax=Brachionus plicatilis TaxID=10195 RepID=A0A3M7SYS3_BRAPC|nr:hypothetical protein BpHYR1_004866 [Brachionus plicatilis]